MRSNVMSLPTNNKSAMLTIDWDYFVPEDPIHDFGHMENLFFLDQIWWFRVQYIDNIKTSGEELVFWNRLREKNIFPIDQVWVSDSHLPAYDIADLYNIDTIDNKKQNKQHTLPENKSTNINKP